MTPFDLEIRNVVCSVPDGRSRRTLLSVPHLDFPGGAFAAVSGVSGAGKTTFLKLISGILPPDSGTVRWGKTELGLLSASERDAWRGTCVGFLFQDFRLFDGLSALENVLLPLTFRGRPDRNDRSRAARLLKCHGVAPDTPAERLSRGEMQRTALVRVLMQSPSVILADEPTASLDAGRGAQAADTLAETAEALGATLIVVSHDERLLSRFNRRLVISDGLLKETAS